MMYVPYFTQESVYSHDFGLIFCAFSIWSPVPLFLQSSGILCYLKSLSLTTKEKAMNSKVSTLEARKKISQAKLDTRRIFLKEKGLSDEAIRKDVAIRKLKAELRKSDFRMAAIAAQEETIRRAAKGKADKLAAAKAPEKESPEELPVKKEKKAKKDRSEKQAKPEAKIEKPENKTEQSQA
jgi:hypothetical protein